MCVWGVNLSRSSGIVKSQALVKLKFCVIDVLSHDNQSMVTCRFATHDDSQVWYKENGELWG